MSKDKFKIGIRVKNKYSGMLGTIQREPIFTSAWEGVFGHESFGGVFVRQDNGLGLFVSEHHLEQHFEHHSE